MSSKHRDNYSDEFDDSEEEDFKPQSRSSAPKKNHYKKPTQKVINLGQAGGGSTKKRPTKRPASAGTVKKPQRSAVEYWSESLQTTGKGLRSTGTGNSMTGLSKKQTKEMAYSSTSHYLRQLVGTEKPKRSVLDSPGRTTPGRPAYKSPEEYYDEILDLKKQITVFQAEGANMKSKVRRLEEDNLKKEREIEQLLDPSKSDELRRTLADRKPDAGAVIHSLKQKILKLEHQLKDREAAYARLQSDLKTTKVEEMKMQIDTFYKEIVRLNQVKSVDAPSSRRQKEEAVVQHRSAENNVKLKALQETILRMNEKNTRLTSENKSLRTDLEKVLEETSKAKDTQKDYEDMSKRQLLASISKLEKRLDRADADSTSILSDIENRQSKVQGKITLEGSVAQRLDQLDRRETELLEEMEKTRSVIKRLKDDRVHYRKKAEDKDKEIKSLKKEIEDLQAELDSMYEKDKSRVTPRASTSTSSAVRRRSPSLTSGSTPRRAGRTSPQTTRSRSPSVSSDTGSKREERERNRRIEQFRQDTAAKHIQRNWRSHHQRQKQRQQDDEAALRRRAIQMARAEEFREAHAARTIQRGWRDHHKRQLRSIAKKEEEDRNWRRERDEKVSQFSENRAAKRIQKGWTGHRERRQKRETELDETAEFLQSALRGHVNRRHQMEAYKNRPPSRGASLYGDDDTESVTESDLDSAAELLQSNMRAHLARKDHLRRSRLEGSDPELDEAVSTVQSAFRGHLARKGMAEKEKQRQHEEETEYDNAVLTLQSAFRSHLVLRDHIDTHRPRSKSPSLSRGSSSHRHRLDSAGEEEDEDDKYSSVSRGSRRSSARAEVRSVAKKPPLSPRKNSRVVVDSDEDSDDDDAIVTTSSRGRIF